MHVGALWGYVYVLFFHSETKACLDGTAGVQDRLKQALVERRTDAESAAIKLSLVETAAQEELAACRSRSAAMEAQGQVH